MKFSNLVQQLGVAAASSLVQSPERDPVLLGVAAVEEAETGTISYIEGAKYAPALLSTGASALILPMDADLQTQADARQIAWVSTPVPRLGFARAIALFYQPYKPAPGIHPSALIDPTATLGEAVAIGPYVVIQAGVTIGDRVCIHPHVVIYPEVTIGPDTTLHANCVIHERSQIGDHCVIHSGAAIGSEGFGFVPTANGWEKMEQSGITILETGVEVGCNATVDRPAVGETRIQRHTKLDNLVHVGHNSNIGPACVLAAQTGLAGGVQVGTQVILGGQVGVANQARIGDRVQAGAKAGIHSYVAPDSVVMGNPASPYRTFLKASAVYRRLPEMQQTVRALERQVAVLEERLRRLEGE